MSEGGMAAYDNDPDSDIEPTWDEIEEKLTQYRATGAYEDAEVVLRLIDRRASELRRRHSDALYVRGDGTGRVDRVELAMEALNLFESDLRATRLG